MLAQDLRANVAKAQARQAGRGHTDPVADSKSPPGILGALIGRQPSRLAGRGGGQGGVGIADDAGAGEPTTCTSGAPVVTSARRDECVDGPAARQMLRPRGGSTAARQAQ
jgi:hypothetical protein